MVPSWLCDCNAARITVKRRRTDKTNVARLGAIRWPRTIPWHALLCSFGSEDPLPHLFPLEVAANLAPISSLQNVMQSCMKGHVSAAVVRRISRCCALRNGQGSPVTPEKNDRASRCARYTNGVESIQKRFETLITSSLTRVLRLRKNVGPRLRICAEHFKYRSHSQLYRVPLITCGSAIYIRLDGR